MFCEGDQLLSKTATLEEVADDIRGPCKLAMHPLLWSAMPVACGGTSSLWRAGRGDRVPSDAVLLGLYSDELVKHAGLARRSGGGVVTQPAHYACGDVLHMAAFEPALVLVVQDGIICRTRLVDADRLCAQAPQQAGRAGVILASAERCRFV